MLAYVVRYTNSNGLMPLVCFLFISVACCHAGVTFHAHCLLKLLEVKSGNWSIDKFLQVHSNNMIYLITINYCH